MRFPPTARRSSRRSDTRYAGTALLLVGTLAVVGFISAVATFWIGASYAALRLLHHLRTADTLPDAIQVRGDRTARIRSCETELTLSRSQDFRSEATDLLSGSSASAKHNGTNGYTKVHFDSVVKQEGEKDVPVKNGDS